MTVSLSSELLVGFLFALVRTSAWIVVAPPFSSSTIPARVKVVVAAGIAVVLAPSLGSHPELFEVGPFLGGLAYQAFTGLALGFLVLLVFAAVQAAGELIDLFSGFTAASLYDPFSNASATPMGRLYQMVAIGILFAVNGHLMLVRGFMESFEHAPLQGPRLDDLGRLLTHDLAGFMVSALEIAAPMLAALFLAEIAMGLLAKAAPQSNVMVLGFAVKIMLVLVLGTLALPLLTDAVPSLVEDVVRNGTRLVRG